MISPFNTFTIHSLTGFMVTAALAVMFYIVYLKAGHNLLDLLSANFILCASVVCLTYFLTDNMVPAGMSSYGWPGGPSAEALRDSTLAIHRFSWAFGLLGLPSQLHFVLHYSQRRNFLRRHIAVVYCLAFLAAPIFWTRLGCTAPAKPLADTASWGATIPWLPDVGPAALVFLVCMLTVQAYGVIQLWKTRKTRVHEYEESLGARHIVFAAFFVQMVISLGDVITSACSVPMPPLGPVGSGLMGILLAIALTRSRMEADRVRSQLAGEKSALLDCVPQPLLYFGNDMRVQWANRHAAAFADPQRSGLVGRRPDEIWDGAGEEPSLIQEALDTGESVEREIAFKDDSTWIVHVSPVIGDKGKLSGVIELATDITQIRRAERALRESNAQILMAREEERRRVAQDLHDSVAQGLTALHMHLHADSINLGVDTAEGKKFDQAAQRCKLIGTEVRQISHQLYPPALDMLGLAAALEDIFSPYRSTGLTCSLECDDELRGMRFSQGVEVALYRTAQEAVSNAVRHGQAREIVVRLERTSDLVSLTVTDDGVGFVVAKTHHGLGMTSMRGRLEGIGGKLTAESRPGHTCIRASIPLALAHDAKGPLDAATAAN